jgi:hypothetical protein
MKQAYKLQRIQSEITITGSAKMSRNEHATLYLNTKIITDEKS